MHQELQTKKLTYFSQIWRIVASLQLLVGDSKNPKGVPKHKCLIFLVGRIFDLLDSKKRFKCMKKQNVGAKEVRLIHVRFSTTRNE